MGYGAYPELKETGTPWLGKVPAHWQVDRAKWAVTGCKNGVWGAEPDGENDIACVRVADFDRTKLTVGDEKLTNRAIAQSDREGRLLKSGDLLLEKSGGGELQPVGAVVQFAHSWPAVTSNFVARMPIAPGMDSRFFAYAHAHLYTGRVNVRSIKQTTGIQNLDSQQYLDEPIAYPPLTEQQTIARFLDHKTAQIDALIAKKQALLQKLAEKRTALISHAVTKGLDPFAPMKDSGVDWLGPIPKHWDVKRLRFLVQMSGGMTPSTANSEYWNGDVPWVTPKDMKVEDISDSIDKLTQEALAKTAIQINDTGCVLIVVRGMILAHSFPVAINMLPVTINQDMKALSTSLDPCYLAILLRGIKNLILSVVEEAAHGTKVMRTDLFKNIHLPVPPLSEQEKVVTEVNRVVSEADRMSSHVASAIARLNEYRSALITAAVTGKIDVRDVPIPEAA